MPPIRETQTPDSSGFSEDSNWTLVSSSPIVKASTPTIPLSPLTDLEDDAVGNDLPVKQARLTRFTRNFPRDSSDFLSCAPRKSVSKSTSVTSSPPKRITINGHVLQPTIVFDTFWRWCAERKSIDDRRRAGEPFPWTEDKVLQTEFFCNAFRVLDKTSQYIIREVIQKGSQEPVEIVFRILLFNTFTRIGTWEWLDERIGPLTWERYRRKDYDVAVEELVQNKISLFTGAFQKPGPRWEHKEAWRNHLCLLEIFMENDLAGKLQEFESMSDAFAFIASFPGMGNFNSYQLLLNLSYSSLLNFSGNDFVVAGIGAEAGLKKLFGSSIDRALKKNPNFRIEVIRWMVENQQDQFRRLGLKFSGLGPENLPMDLADIEHAVCEVDKYARKVHPSIKDSKNGRTESRRQFTPSDEPYPAIPVFPAAWSHPQRKVVRPCNLRPKVKKRWVVESIVAHRYDGDKLYCRVRWYNYPPKDDTWEIVDELVEDAPILVDSYWKKTTGKTYTSSP